MLARHALRAVALSALVSCRATVRPAISPSEFLSATPPVPGRVVLVISDELRSYRPTSHNYVDLKTWVFEVGPCTVDAFRYALEARFAEVLVAPASREPAAPAGDERLVAVVRPAMTGFDGDEPFFKFGRYNVELGCRVTVLDAAGAVLYERDYLSDGDRRGAIGRDSAGHAAHPETYRAAVVKLARSVAEDLAAFAGAPAPEA